MKLTFTKTAPPIKMNCFEIYVEYQHGDADTSDVEAYTLNTTSHSDLERYIVTFNRVKSAIDDMRAYGSELPDWIKNVDSVIVDGTKFHIQLVSDDFSMRDNYYAEMRILKILFYDETGEEFKVDYKL